MENKANSFVTILNIHRWPTIELKGFGIELIAVRSVVQNRRQKHVNGSKRPAWLFYNFDIAINKGHNIKVI